MGTGSLVNQDGVTLVRLRGNLTLGFGEVPAAGNAARVAVGVGVTTAEAFAIGATAIPSPLADAEWDGWLWHTFAPLVALTNAIEQSEGTSAVRIDVDSRAMRKLTVDMVVFAAIEVENLSGVTDVRALFDSRMLLKLP
ncbi:hypothetical protein [Campylobacter concisus]|uniref:hypothetical protein n=1 Tax=Campylobacter concisus TaxID=199 RepID=UPI00112FC33A|nr:hypothetical protein [Campylobacter concisus]